MNVNIHIERLVLDGLSVPCPQQTLLQAAVETELQRLITINGLSSGLQSGGAISHISGSEIQLTGNAENDPTYLGRQIAQAVCEGVSR
jgi:hypothetical protein